MIKYGKVQHGKIQAGDTILDAEIEIEDKVPEKPEPDVMQMFRVFMKEFPTWPVTAGFNDAPVVEGSVVNPDMKPHPYKNICCGEEFDPRGPVREPITDEKRLLS